MKNPVKLQSDALTRSMRRDTMVGTAVMLMIETGLIGVAAAMDGLNTEADQPEQHDGEQSARKARPVADTQPLPDTPVATAGKHGPVPSQPLDNVDPPSVDFTRHGSSDLHHPHASGVTTGSLADFGGIGFGQNFGRIDQGATQPSQHSGLSGGALVSGSEPASEEPTDGQDTPPVKPPMRVLIGTDGDDTIKGGEGDDYIFGGDGDDLLTGSGGNDRLLGGKGDDVLIGGAGNDILVGDKGDDTMTGGAGSDTFVFRAGFGHDTVTDFKANGDHDVINLAKNDFADFAALANTLAETDSGVVLTLHDGSTLTLSHVTLTSLTANDFRFDV